MKLELSATELELLIAMLTYAETSASDHRHAEVSVAMADLRPLRSRLIAGYLQQMSSLAAEGTTS